MARVFWFRRDLRLNDNPALNRALEGSQTDGDLVVLATFAKSPQDFQKLSPIRQHSLNAGLLALKNSLGEGLNIRHEAAETALVLAAQLVGAKVVHACEAFDPEGVAEQNAVGEALAKNGIRLTLTGSYYAVNPGSIKKPDGTPYKVYTPFFRNWLEFGWDAPVALAEVGQKWHFDDAFDHGLFEATEAEPFEIRAGEAFAIQTWQKFQKRALADYSENRNRADLSGTSHLSHALAHGEIHPRTLLAQLGDGDGDTVFRKEIAWREFNADVLWQKPNSLHDYYEPRFARMRYDTGDLAEQRLHAWKQGKTGYPMVDAGMRQLLADGWVHNRVRMIVASFLVKDLHLEWQQGAEWFEYLLTDYDPASNAHGWQWTAGSGTDASPYYRVFNPILQGYKFDPNGDYVRKYIPELRHVDGAKVHEPWLLIDGLANGYVAPIVDHSEERNESLARLEELKHLG